jgi:DNA repair protein RecO
LVRIQQCDLIESFHKAQSDYGLSTGLALVSEISELVLPEHEVAEPMFRLILLTARQIEKAGSWSVPLSYFAFWTVRLGGWLPRFDQCAICDTYFGSRAAYHDSTEAGLLCENCRRPGMKALRAEGRKLAERFAGERLDRIEHASLAAGAAKELFEASLSWIEHHTERKLKTKELLETA